MRPLHPFRRRGSRRRTDRLRVPRRPHRSRDLPRPAIRLVLLGEHGADLPRRRVDRAPVPLQVPAVGSRAGGVDLHDLRSRLSTRRPVLCRPARALPRRGFRSGQPELALRQGPLQLRIGLRRATDSLSSRCCDGRRARRVRWHEALGEVGRSSPRRSSSRGRSRSASSAGHASPTRTPTPGPSSPSRSSAPTPSMHSSEMACPLKPCSACHARRSMRRCSASLVVLLAPDLREELPVLFLRLREAAA